MPYRLDANTCIQHLRGRSAAFGFGIEALVKWAFEASGKPDCPVVASRVGFPGEPEDADYQEDDRTGRLPLRPTPGSR